MRTAFDRRASPVGGPNLADAASNATERFDSETGRFAVRAIRDASNGSHPIRGRVPPELRERVVPDLASLHRQVRNVSVSVERGALATLSVSPARRLAARLRERRAELVAAPERYDDVAGKARVAVRAAYLDAVLAALDEQAGRQRRTRRRADAALRAADVGGLDGLERLLEAGTAPVAAGPIETRGRFGRIRTDVSTDPVYLAASSTDDGSPSLATRNLNLVVPYDDIGESVADALTRALFGGDTVRLTTAARTLRSARRGATVTGNATLERDTRRLSRVVNTSVRRVRARLERTLRRRGVARRHRRAAVAAALARWDEPSTRALALANGSITPRVVAAVARRAPRFRDPARRVALRAAVNETLRRSLRSDRVRVAERPVDVAGERLQWLARATTREVTGRAVERGADGVRRRLRGPLSAVPAGVPVTPVPGYWYATTNVWHVEVRGRYERVRLRALTGRPPTGTIAYVRDGSRVRLDVDGDGTPERLGVADRVSFEVSTAVVVAVPPGPRGVGDKNGNADERSAGWPGSRNETTYPPPL